MSRILVTNDDGVDAPGILALARAMRQFGEVEVAAPAFNQSGSGHKKTLNVDISISEKMLDDDIPALVVNSSPADCIAIASKGLRNWPPRVVVSGINRGENLSQDVTYSGTVTAALESTINGVPAIAVSLGNGAATDVSEYEEAARIAAIIVQQVIDRGLPPLTILNVNVPPGEIKGLRLTRQGLRIYHDEIEQDGDVVRMVGSPPTGNLEELGSDLRALANGYVSITPIHLDMTAHHFMADLANWNIEI
ncbi:5'/3'-nucleotidase SurE [Phototrophicus methaneseepsis]|uniref:5'-nucleotidase SurE n=1 Tax=Phototrophicus methaneseepsis TaxID=2710758 RepID=A0A7S8E951_9CHLR|nr:5'/3'-nucleotidase SurE [Phototrophicus methaneseepsis]QPC82676.1 5'/3'-nucleotidase SurE [Phototrophicus methaneseepsis]